MPGACSARPVTNGSPSASSVTSSLSPSRSETTESTFARDEMYLADEVFFTGTAAELTPVHEIDDRKIGAGECGPITRKLQDAYFDAVKGRAGQEKARSLLEARPPGTGCWPRLPAAFRRIQSNAPGPSESSA